MQLENYFDFLGEDDIRIRGTRIGIETVLEDYLEGSSPEEIAARYRSLSMEQVYATITYYWHSRDQVEEYLQEWRDYSDQADESRATSVGRDQASAKTTRATRLDAECHPLSKICFLLDENMPHAVRDQLLLHEPKWRYSQWEMIPRLLLARPIQTSCMDRSQRCRSG